MGVGVELGKGGGVDRGAGRATCRGPVPPRGAYAALPTPPTPLRRTIIGCADPPVRNPLPCPIAERLGSLRGVECAGPKGEPWCLRALWLGAVLCCAALRCAVLCCAVAAAPLLACGCLVWGAGGQAAHVHAAHSPLRQMAARPADAPTSVRLLLAPAPPVDACRAPWQQCPPTPPGLCTAAPCFPFRQGRRCGGAAAMHS